MNKLVVALLTLVFVFESLSVVQAQSTDDEYEKLIAEDENLYFVPDQTIVKGLKITKQLHAAVDGSDFNYPQTIGIHGGYLWIFDVEIEKLLKFSLDGEFLGSPFPEDLKIVNHIKFMDFDDQGRILLTDGRDYYIFEEGKELEKYSQNYWIMGAFWDSPEVLSINPYYVERKEGLFQSINLKTGERQTWGILPEKVSFPEAPYFLENARSSRGIVTSISLDNLFLVTDLDKKEVVAFSPDIPAFNLRHQKTKAVIEYSKKKGKRGYRFFPVYGSCVVLNDRTFVIDAMSRFIRILEFDSEFNLTTVYQMLRQNKRGLANFAVAENNNQLQFYLNTYQRKGNEVLREVFLVESTEKAPTLADAKALAEKEALDPELQKQQEEMEKTRAISKEYNKIGDAARNSEDKTKLFDQYVEFYKKYPENWVGHLALYDASRITDEEGARLIKPYVVKELEKAKKPVDRANLATALYNIAKLLEEKETLEMAWNYSLIDRYMFYEVLRYLESTRELKAWDFMESVLHDAYKRIDEKSLAHMVGSGTTAEPSLDGRKFMYLLSYYQGVLAFERGEYEAALTHFKQAERNQTIEDVGKYDDLYAAYKARSLAALSKHDEAIELLLPLALFTDQQQNMEALEEIYAQSGREKSFTEFIASEKANRKQKLGELVVFDLDKNPVTVNDKLGKLTILTFWTPDT